MISNHFIISTVSSECIVEELQKQEDLEVNKSNVLVEYGDPIIKQVRDVILMDKVIIIIIIF